MKRIFKLIICACLMVSFMGACSKDGSDNATVGSTLAEVFEEIVEGKSTLEVAEALATHKSLPFSGMAMEVEEGASF